MGRPRIADGSKATSISLSVVDIDRLNWLQAQMGYNDRSPVVRRLIAEEYTRRSDFIARRNQLLEEIRQKSDEIKVLEQKIVEPQLEVERQIVEEEAFIRGLIPHYREWMAKVDDSANNPFTSQRFYERMFCMAAESRTRLKERWFLDGGWSSREEALSWFASLPKDVDPNDIKDIPTRSRKKLEQMRKEIQDALNGPSAGGTELAVGQEDAD